MPNSFWGIPLVYKLYIYKVYLLLRDAKLVTRDSIYKLYINTVYLLLRGYQTPSEGCQRPSEGFRLSNSEVYAPLRTYYRTIPHFWGTEEFKIISYTFPLPLEVLYHKFCQSDDVSWSRDAPPSCPTSRRSPKQLSFLVLLDHILLRATTFSILF